MAYASKAGRARTSARDPRAHAICDRCSFRYNFEDLRFQYDWGGATMINKRILVCSRCYDDPQDQARSIVIPADPVPIVNARPQLYDAAESDYMTLTPATRDPITGLPIPNTTVMSMNTAGDFNNDFNDDFSGQGPVRPMVGQPVGRPKGYTQSAQAPLVILPVVAMLSSGGNVIVVTTASPHGLGAGSQVSVQNVAYAGASGTYSVDVANPTQFVYQTNAAIPAGSLLMARTLVTPMTIGIPLNLDQLPQTGT